MTDVKAQPRVVIMAGGTGGHVFPALAVAEALRDRGCHIEWLGTQAGLEARVVPEAGFTLRCLPVRGLRGKSRWQQLLAPLRLLLSVWHAWRWLAQTKPQLVVGFGGYVAAPGGLAAWLRGIPLVIHEQNARAGTTNRLLSRFAREVLAGFEGALPGARVTGNPLRALFYRQLPPQVRFEQRPLDAPLRLLVLGGSLGAKVLNETLPRALPACEFSWQLHHQSGERTFESARQAYEPLIAAGFVIQLTPFIEQVAEALADADIVICRAGALTLAELQAVGVPSLLIPYPYAIDDHQTANAASLVAKSAAVLIPESQLTPALLAENLNALARDRQKRLTMALNAWRRPTDKSATEQVVDLCLTFLQ